MNRLFDSPLLLLRLTFAAMLLPASCIAAVDSSPELPDPTVRITDQDGTLQVSISLRVAVLPREAWAVLTDFEHMPDFIPNLESSQVLLRAGKSLQVEQKGSISLGVLPIHYESKRQVDLTPYKMIRSHSLSGNTRLDSVMVLTPIGKDTLLAYRATAVPDLPVPNSLISSYMGDMLEGQFKAMGQEMLRRAHPVDQKNDASEDTQLAQQSEEQTVQKPEQTIQAGAVKKTAAQTKTAPRKTRVRTKKQPG